MRVSSAQSAQSGSFCRMRFTRVRFLFVRQTPLAAPRTRALSTDWTSSVSYSLQTGAQHAEESKDSKTLTDRGRGDRKIVKNLPIFTVQGIPGPRLPCQWGMFSGFLFSQHGKDSCGVFWAIWRFHAYSELSGVKLFDFWTTLKFNSKFRIPILIAMQLFDYNLRNMQPKISIILGEGHPAARSSPRMNAYLCSQL